MTKPPRLEAKDPAALAEDLEQASTHNPGFTPANESCGIYAIKYPGPANSKYDGPDHI